MSIIRHRCYSIMGHVDAGKTTLSECILYHTGRIKSLGRVDKGDAFLDTDAIEKERGITIFSKQAIFDLGDNQITLVDTPGHVDFSAETERVIKILDGAILVISGSEGVQSHTRTLMYLLERYGVPTYIFVNKMDQPVSNREGVMDSLRKAFGEGCVDMTDLSLTDTSGWPEEAREQVAVCDDNLLADYLETGRLETSALANLTGRRRLFPVWFGSALKDAGVGPFLTGLGQLMPQVDIKENESLSARVFKISRDKAGVRLVHLKVLSGALRVRDSIHLTDEEGEYDEKISQIRRYNGEKYETVQEAVPGMVCAVTGMDHAKAGDFIGEGSDECRPFLEPVISYRLILPPSEDPVLCWQKLKVLGEEEPDLQLSIDETNRDIHVKLMGEIQTQVLKQRIFDRFGIEVDFGESSIVYKETIANTVEGVGHFEPLRHFAEVHLLMSPLEEGSGLVFDTDCREDILDKNWQRLVLTHLREKNHRGVLTGSFITDMRITLVSGKAHLKHTEGGDFRQATYRAVRNGLMQAESRLLEPYYNFELVIPQTMVGRAMTDLERFFAKGFTPEMDGELAVIRGSGPVSTLQSYQKEVVEYTRGQGRISFSLKGYGACHNEKEVIENSGYDPERDLRNPADSVFCEHGAGYVVPWYEVSRYMHMPSYFSEGKTLSEEEIIEHVRVRSTSRVSDNIGTEEIDSIINSTAYANRRKEFVPHKGIGHKTRKIIEAAEQTPVKYKPAEKLPEYLLIDGYNVIFAWEELKELAGVSVDGARGRLLDILCNYQAIKGCELIAVFDAYRVQGHREEAMDYHNIHVVFTREAETADMYIERFAHNSRGKRNVTVVTSDGLEQIIIRGEGCGLISAREFKNITESAGRAALEDYSSHG